MESPLTRFTRTGLARNSCALAISGQAFHWFDLPRALEEFDRVVRPGGAVAAFWNTRAPGPFEDAYHALLLRRSSEYGVLRAGPTTLQRLRDALGEREVHETVLAIHQDLDWAEHYGRARSSSYVAHGVADQEGFEGELRALFDAHAVAGRLRLAYDLRVILWRR